MSFDRFILRFIAHLNERKRDAAFRELEEETGIRVSNDVKQACKEIVLTKSVEGGQVTLKSSVFVIFSDEKMKEEVVKNVSSKCNEFVNAEWVDLAELKAKLHTKYKSCVFHELIDQDKIELFIDELIELAVLDSIDNLTIKEE